jgi:PAS domain S-box-containing protein
MHDITERKLAEQALRQAYEELELRVQERTVQLARTNEYLKAEIKERLLVEEALRNSEARLRRLVESNIIGVLFPDLSGNVTEANDAFLQMIGYTRQDLIAGKIRWDEMTPPEYLAVDLKAIGQLRTYGFTDPSRRSTSAKTAAAFPFCSEPLCWKARRISASPLSSISPSERKQRRSYGKAKSG